MSYAIIVDFRLRSGTRNAFRRLVDANAFASAKVEPGCRRFDVLEPKDDPDRVVLYEIYDDRAAFDAHTRTRHVGEFDSDSKQLVLTKSVTELTLVCDGSK